MKRRRKTVIAGALVSVVEYTPPMPRDGERQRRARQKATTAARRYLNFRTAQSRLEMKLAANFKCGDFFATFTYADGNEPKSRAENNRRKREYLRKLRDQRRRRGQATKWVFSPENRHGQGRWHLHAIINATGAAVDFDELCSLWPWGHVEVGRLFDADHRFTTWLDVARYLTKERPEDGADGTPVGAQIYSCSRNLKRPEIITEWISEGTTLAIPPGAYILGREETETEWSRYSYLKYLTAPLYQKGEAPFSPRN